MRRIASRVCLDVEIPRRIQAQNSYTIHKFHSFDIVDVGLQCIL